MIRNQKKYEYNTNSLNSNEKDRYKHKYTNNVLVHDYPISSTTPINKKNFINNSMQQEKSKINSSMTSAHQHYLNYHKNQEKYEPRKRINSASNMKRNQDKINVQSKSKNFMLEENCKNGKKVYFGDDSYNNQFDSIYNKANKINKYSIRDEKALNNEQNDTNVLQQNINHLNNRNERNKDYAQYRNQLKGYEASVQINQKDIFDKIGRINRINQEINNRLAKMLNKIDNV